MAVLQAGVLSEELIKAFTDKDFMKVVAGIKWTYDHVKRGGETKAYIDARTVDLLAPRYSGLPVETLIAMFIDTLDSDGCRNVKGFKEGLTSTIVSNKMIAIGLELYQHLEFEQA